MITVNFENVREATTNGNGSGNNNPPAGGYVAKIIDITHKEKNMGIVVDLDIDEGEWTKFYSSLNAKYGFWALSTFRSYKPKALPFFKRFVNCIERSNDGYHWDGDETQLVGKIVGIVLCYEEYIGNDGNVKQRAVIDQFMDAKEVYTGDYKVPELKTIEKPNSKPTEVVNMATKFEAVDDKTDIPF